MSKRKYAFVGAVVGGIFGLFAVMALGDYVVVVVADKTTVLNCGIGGLIFGAIAGKCLSSYDSDGGCCGSVVIGMLFGVLFGMILIVAHIILIIKYGFAGALEYMNTRGINFILRIMLFVVITIVGWYVGALVGFIADALVGTLVGSCRIRSAAVGMICGIVFGIVFGSLTVDILFVDESPLSPLATIPIFIVPIFTVIGYIGGAFLGKIIDRKTVEKRRREEVERQLDVKRREQERKEQMHREGMKQEILDKIEEVAEER